MALFLSFKNGHFHHHRSFQSHFLPVDQMPSDFYTCPSHLTPTSTFPSAISHQLYSIQPALLHSFPARFSMFSQLKLMLLLSSHESEPEPEKFPPLSCLFLTFSPFVLLSDLLFVDCHPDHHLLFIWPACLECISMHLSHPVFACLPKSTSHIRICLGFWLHKDFVFCICHSAWFSSSVLCITVNGRWERQAITFILCIARVSV